MLPEVKTEESDPWEKLGGHPAPKHSLCPSANMHNTSCTEQKSHRDKKPTQELCKSTQQLQEQDSSVADRACGTELALPCCCKHRVLLVDEPRPQGTSPRVQGMAGCRVLICQPGTQTQSSG